ncbi:MAG: GPI anchored serine-threonine rich family protein [Candidatus Hodarchaeales archaeon]|jgi:hypothetical protein
MKKSLFVYTLAVLLVFPLLINYNIFLVLQISQEEANEFISDLQEEFSKSVRYKQLSTGERNGTTIVNLPQAQWALSNGEYGYFSGQWFENDVIDWSFSASGAGIEVWAFNDTEFLAHSSQIDLATGYQLSDGSNSADTGTWTVVSNGSYLAEITWYILFWNNVPQDIIVNAFVEERTITLISPTSSSNFTTGLKYTISWTSTELNLENVKIELFKGNSYHSTLIASTINNGSIRCFFPHSIPTGTDYQIKISDSDFPNSTTYSDYFVITQSIPEFPSQVIVFLSIVFVIFMIGLNHKKKKI